MSVGVISASSRYIGQNTDKRTVKVKKQKLKREPLEPYLDEYKKFKKSVRHNSNSLPLNVSRVKKLDIKNHGPVDTIVNLPADSIFDKSTQVKIPFDFHKAETSERRLTWIGIGLGVNTIAGFFLFGYGGIQMIQDKDTEKSMMEQTVRYILITLGLIMCSFGGIGLCAAAESTQKIRNARNKALRRDLNRNLLNA